MTKHAYEFNNPPGILDTADQFLTEVLNALNECKPTSLVTVAEDCKPLND